MGLFLGSQLISPAEIVNQGGGSSAKFGVSMDNIFGNVTNGVLGSPTQINGITFTGVTSIAQGALENCMPNGDVTGSISFPSLTSIGVNGLNFAFSSNQITSVLFPSLTTIGSNGMAYAFESNEITLVSFPELTTIGESGMQQAFEGNEITSISFPSLTIIGEHGMESAFTSNQITSVSFPSLTSIGVCGMQLAFEHQYNTNDECTLTSVSFPALTSDSFADETCFDNMLIENEDVTVHFPSNLEEVIGEWDSVLDGFGGTNTVVLFDLPATE